MSMLAQAKQFFVIPTLTAMGSDLNSTTAINLVTGIGNVETRYLAVRQVTNDGFGPARGFWQMEPATHDDCWVNFLAYRPDLAAKVLAILGSAAPSSDLLIPRMDYAVAMCRVQLYRALPPLPAANDAAGMADYHKRWWNTSAGAADARANAPLFQQAIAA